MSKEDKSEPDYKAPKKINGKHISHLEGKLKTLIDSVIPPEIEGDWSTSIKQTDQNSSIKDLINMILWDWYNHQN